MYSSHHLSFRLQWAAAGRENQRNASKPKQISIEEKSGEYLACPIRLREESMP
jgi:hypothetical protein